MAVVRVRASDPTRRIGVLFVHPGGHLSGVSFVLKGVGDPAFIRLRERFDIVSLDPRGAGRTRPLNCGFDLPEFPSDTSDAALIAFFDDRGRRIAEQCLDQDRAFVLSISGNNFARDIDMVRRALGERQLSLAMISNSGPVGAVYASLFPKRVRAMLLDSTVAPEFRDHLIERLTEQSASYEFALQRVNQLCLRIAGCPLRATGVVATYDAVRAKLEVAPVTSPAGIPFTAGDLAAVFQSLLPDERQWPLIIGALASAFAGDFTLFFQLQSSGGSTSGRATATTRSRPDCATTTARAGLPRTISPSSKPSATRIRASSAASRWRFLRLDAPRGLRPTRL